MLAIFRLGSKHTLIQTGQKSGKFALCLNEKSSTIDGLTSAKMPRIGHGRTACGNSRNVNMFGNPYMSMMPPRPPMLDHRQPSIEDVSRWLEPYESFRHDDIQPAGVPRNQPRRVNCGELREVDDGDVVEIFGRVQNQQLGRFVVIKDSHGATQLVAHDENIARRLQKIPVNANITVIGRVKRRPLRQINEKIATGGIEVNIMDILSVRRSLSLIPHKPVKMNRIQVRHSSTKSGSVIKLTSTELKRCTTAGIRDAFLQRSHTCGELGAEHVGLKVSLCGWICHNHFSKFIHLKDGYGVVQAVVPPNKTHISSALKSAEPDSIVEIYGVVKYRPSGHLSPAMETGMIEVVLESFALAKDKIGASDPPDECSDSGNEDEAHGTSNVNRFCQRTHTCGQLRDEHIGQNVILCGWLWYERMKKFLVIRDSYGSTQCVISDEMVDIIDQIKNISYESVVQIEGTVAARPPVSIKTQMPTGQIEVCVQKLTVLNRAKPNLPFAIKSSSKVKETLRLQHRYLDLRFPEMQYNLRMRSKLLMRMREFLINHCDFVDVETPTLFRKTPGGAQEFIVPTQALGKCYSLVQSPQQLKQMLMVGGIDRYFQVARCYRDEGSRSDRQPEFTQLDIEMSFTDREGIIDLIEQLLKYTCDDLNLKIPFPRITYKESMERYGTDRPDLRFGNEIKNCTDDFKLIAENGCAESFAAHALVITDVGVPKLPAPFRHILDVLQPQYPNMKCIDSVIPSSSPVEWVSKMTPLLTEPVARALNQRFQFQSQDVLFLAFGKETQVLDYLGKIRLEFKKCLENMGKPKRDDESKFVWIIDFPLFEKNEQNSSLSSAHHPFTQPHPEDIFLVDPDPLKARGLSFDLVLNGNEVGGGSMRIHDANFQRHILEDILKIDVTSMQHLLEALEAGCPPHGGIALGLDRFFSMILNTHSIREVIAFPKTIDGKDLLSGAPAPISEVDQNVYKLKYEEVNKKDTISGDDVVQIKSS